MGILRRLREFKFFTLMFPSCECWAKHWTSVCVSFVLFFFLLLFFIIFQVPFDSMSYTGLL